MDAVDKTLVAVFADLFDECTNAPDLNEKFGLVAQAFSFNFYHYFVESNPTSGHPVRHRVLSTFPVDWMEHWIAERYEDIDIWARAARHREGLVSWSEVVSRSHSSNVHRRLLAEAKAAGLADGMTIAICGRLATAFVVLATSDTSHDAADTAKRCGSVLYAVATAFHRRASTVVADHATVDAGRQSALSPREREVLRWIASGKTDWEIGRILEISERAVKFHAAGARRKLRAANRTHAVALAMAAHLIESNRRLD